MTSCEAGRSVDWRAGEQLDYQLELRTNWLNITILAKDSAL